MSDIRTARQTVNRVALQTRISGTSPVLSAHEQRRARDFDAARLFARDSPAAVHVAGRESRRLEQHVLWLERVGWRRCELFGRTSAGTSGATRARAARLLERRPARDRRRRLLVPVGGAPAISGRRSTWRRGRAAQSAAAKRFPRTRRCDRAHSLAIPAFHNATTLD